MSTPTYTLINQITLAATASSVTFSSLPQGYRDLVLTIEGTMSAFDGVGLVFNNDSASNYTTVVGYGTGSTAAAINYTGGEAGAGILSTSQGDVVCAIMDYTAIDKHKTLISTSGVPAGQVRMTASRWASTSAITQVAVNAAATTRNFGVSTIFSLYGIVG